MRKNSLKSYIIIATLLSALTSGCSSLDRIPWAGSMPLDPVVIEEPQTEYAVSIIPPKSELEEYTVFVENMDYRLAPYEPSVGIYLGAYILSNPAIDYDIRRFESAIGKSHAMYSYYTSIGGNLPASWLLSCISQYKTNNIIVKVSQLDVDDDQIRECAQEIGKFNVPVFIQLAPVESSFDSVKYKQFFIRAREIIAGRLPNAAIVWTVKTEDAFDCMKYYPGDEYVDWVGICLYQTVNPDGAYNPEIMAAFEHFYYTFQKTKPIMLSEYAVSHQSSRDSVYRAPLAAAEISRIYSQIPLFYPRVKAVTYMDVNALNIASNRDVRDNFTLLEQPEILEAYSKAVDTSDYLSRIDPRAVAEQRSQLIRSPFVAYKINGELYISRTTVEQDLNIIGAANRLEMKTINGRDYFAASALSHAGVGRIETNASRKTVVIKR